VYTNAAADGVVLQLYWGHDFCKIASTIKVIIFSPRMTPPQWKVMDAHLVPEYTVSVPENISLYFCKAVNTRM
jgi:hypothetical protein